MVLRPEWSAFPRICHTGGRWATRNSQEFRLGFKLVYLVASRPVSGVEC